MPNSFKCSNGHQWDTVPVQGSDETTDFGKCPFCGETVVLPSSGVVSSSWAQATADYTPRTDIERTQQLSFISLDRTQNFSITPLTDTQGRKKVAALSIGSMVGNYKILGELGRGGMGLVYRAHDQKSDRYVALKTLKAMDPELLHAFKSEFRTISNVSHPNLVALHELVSDGESWYITMEIIQGTEFLSYVRHWDKTKGAVPPPFDHEMDQRLRDALKQVAIGLNAIHSAGIGRILAQQSPCVSSFRGAWLSLVASRPVLRVYMDFEENWIGLECEAAALSRV